MLDIWIHFFKRRKCIFLNRNRLCVSLVAPQKLSHKQNYLKSPCRSLNYSLGEGVESGVGEGPAEGICTDGGVDEEESAELGLGGIR
jgi:hypothetical protein